MYSNGNMLCTAMEICFHTPNSLFIITLTKNYYLRQDNREQPHWQCFFGKLVQVWLEDITPKLYPINGLQKPVEVLCVSVVPMPHDLPYI